MKKLSSRCTRRLDSGNRFQNRRKTLMLPLPLAGAAVYRLDKAVLLIEGFRP